MLVLSREVAVNCPLLLLQCTQPPTPIATERSNLCGCQLGRCWHHFYIVTTRAEVKQKI